MNAITDNNSVKTNSSFEWIPMALIFALVMTTYSVVLTSRFGLLDDYAFLQNGITNSDATFNLLVSAGRPINAWFFDVGFAAAGTIENLAVLRLITLLGIGLLGCALYYFSRRHGLSLIASTSIATGIVLLPSFQVYAGWAQHFTTPFAAISAVFAAYLLSPVRSSDKCLGVRVVLQATTLLATAVLTYHPTAMFFCTAVLVAVLSSSDPLRDWSWRRLLYVLMTFGFAMTIGFVALKVGQSFFPEDSARYGLLTDPLGKLVWFLREPLVNAASLYSIPGSKKIAGMIAFVAGVGFMFYYLRNGAKTSLFVLVLWMSCLFGSYFPNLATGENWASYRSIGALGASALITIVILIVNPAEKYLLRMSTGKRALSSITATVGIALIIFLSILAQRTVSNAIIMPNASELDNVSVHLGKHIGNEHISRILVRPSNWADSAASPMAYDELGFQSSYKSYYAAAIVDIVRKSRNVFLDANIVVLEGGDIPLVNEETELLVDFSILATSGKFRSIRDPSSSEREVVLVNITDNNWTNGIWTNREEPTEFSFVFRKSENGYFLKTGDVLAFARSGLRRIIKITRSGEYSNVLVEGPPLLPEDGYPATVKVARRSGQAK